MRKSIWSAVILLLTPTVVMLQGKPTTTVRGTLPGYVVHFDFFNNEREGRELVRVAAKAGAKVINLVPPGHVWDRAESVRMLDGIVDEIARRGLQFVICRIDAAHPPDAEGNRRSYLFGKILTQPGVMPNGQVASELFRSTVGRKGYAEWMEEETRYYATRYGANPQLIGINLGPFSEPFVSQRGGFLEYDFASGLYEVTQYTPEGRDVWRQWLSTHYSRVERVNAEYGTSFRDFEGIPLPLSEADTRFVRSDLAFFDWVLCINDWFLERYRRCRTIWHEVSGRQDVPFILQFSCGLAEKFYLGRPAYVGFDIPAWIDMADAVGLSLYTNYGFADWGHASMEATVRMAATARDLGKDVFVLESGNEAPEVVLDPVQVAFFGSVGRRLQPRTYIYEFLRETFDEPYPDNPGKIVGRDGRIRAKTLATLRNLMRDIERSLVPEERPALYVVSLAGNARLNASLGELNSALYELATRIPVRWVPAGKESIIRPGVPVIASDGTVRGSDERLATLLGGMPPKGTDGREAWLASVVDALAPAGK